MPEGGSVTHWLHQLEDGDSAAPEALWGRYFDRLVRLAAKKLGSAPRRAADEEDVALSAFDSFFRGAACGRFPNLRDRDNLWTLLVTIAERKAINLARHEHRKKRDAGRLAADATPPGSADESAVDGPLNWLIGREPSAELVAMMEEEFRLLLDRLPDEEFRQIAVLKMEGNTNADIASLISRSEPTVERRLNRIRKLWEQEGVR